MLFKHTGRAAKGGLRVRSVPNGRDGISKGAGLFKDVVQSVLPKPGAPPLLQQPVPMSNSISKAALFSKLWGILNVPGENCSGEFEVNMEGKKRRKNEREKKKEKK